VKKIIIVDDNKKFRDALKFLINTIENAEVIAEASNGIEFLELLEKHSPDLVFMDIEMSVMNGIEATKIVNDQYPRLKIIGLSFHEEFEPKRNLIFAGAQSFITKNKLTKELLTKIILNNIHKNIK